MLIAFCWPLNDNIFSWSFGCIWDSFFFPPRRIHTFSNTVQMQFVTRECPDYPWGLGTSSLPESWINLLFRSIDLGIFHKRQVCCCTQVSLCWLTVGHLMCHLDLQIQMLCVPVPFSLTHLTWVWTQAHVRMLISVSSCRWSPHEDSCKTPAFPLLVTLIMDWLNIYWAPICTSSVPGARYRGE